MPTLENHLLIASPRLNDSRFVGTVVLLIQHGEDGSFGLVLNRPLCETVSDLWEELGEPPCDCDENLNAGGPTSGPVLALHSDPTYADVRLVPDVFLAVQPCNLNWTVRQHGQSFRLFVGAAKWEPGQLDEEVSAGDWLVASATKELIFSDQGELWERAIHEYGRSFYREVLGSGVIFPADVSLN